MKAVAYSIKSVEKEPLVKANGKRHDITLISNRLSADTISYAQGKEAVLIDAGDDVSGKILRQLAKMGVKLVVCRSKSTDHIDLSEAKKLNIQVASIPEYNPESVAEHTLTLMLALSRNIIPANRQMMHQDFTHDNLLGTTISNKTIGIVGFGQTGKTLAQILKGFNIELLVADNKDVSVECSSLNANQVSLEELFERSDIITFHIPLTRETRHLVNASSIARMKDGVMLINVSSGEIMKSIDVYNALQQEKISKIGLDVYEFEKDIFFLDHSSHAVTDKLLKAFIQNSRVLLTPHQAFLTKEGIQLIAQQTINCLDSWNEQKADLKTV